jgi:hypothetical protein
LYLSAGSSSVSECAVERANVTGNTAARWGAAVLFGAPAFRFQFCEIWSNEGSNCILFGTHTTDLIRCISVRSNVADDRDAPYRGLFSATHSVTISDSAIAGNDATIFVTGEVSSVLFTFSGCHLDTFEQTASGGAFSTVNCFTDGAEFLGLPPVCLTRTASSTRSRLATAPFTPPLQVLFHSRKMIVVRFWCFLTVVWNHPWE